MRGKDALLAMVCVCFVRVGGLACETQEVEREQDEFGFLVIARFH